MNATETFLSERVCLSVRLISKAKKTLKDNGYITIDTFSKNFKKYSVIKVTEKMLQAFILPNTHSMRDRTSTVCVTENAQHALPNTHEMSPITHSVRDDNARYACSDHAQCAFINKYKEIEEINSKETHTAPNFENVPLPTDDDYICGEVRDEMPQTFELTPLETKPATTEQVKEKSSAKREKNKKYTYPTSAEEVLELFKQWRDKHVKLEPRIQGVNLELEAEKFFEYWEDNDWSRKGKKMKSVNGSIATWLGNCCDKVKNIKPALTSEQLERLNAIGEKYNPDKPKPVEAEFEIVEDNTLPDPEMLLNPVTNMADIEAMLKRTLYK